MAIDPSTLEWGYRSYGGTDAKNQKANYSFNFKSNGQDLTFIPSSVINKGVDAGEDKYVLPWFLNQDNLAQLGKVGQYVDLAGQSWYGDYLKDTVGASTTGFLIPTGSLPFDSKISTTKADIKGIGQTEDGPSYILDSQGSDGKYIKPNGNVVTLTKGRSILGDVFGGLGDAFSGAFNSALSSVNDLGPWATAAISAYNPALGAAIAGANTGKAVGSGQADLGDVAKSAAAAYAGSQLGGGVGAEYGQAAGQVAGSTASGLLQGRDLESSLGNAAINTGAYQAAGGLINAFNTPSVNYDLTTGQKTGGLGLKANMGSYDASNPYSFTFGNLDSMGGGTGIQVPTQEGATLGSIGADVMASGGSSNLATQNLLGKLLSSALIGSTGTGNNNMATTNPQDRNAALNSLLGGLLGGAGNLMQGATNVAAREKMASELRAAGQQAAQASQFRPVGTTTRFGSSNFQVDPTTGQLTSAGYTATPLAQGYQDQLAGMTSQGLMQGQQLQGLASQYLGESPEAVRQRYMEQQNALLAPGNEQALAGIRNNLFQTGRQGLATGATSAGGLAATNPEMAAYYNALANQQRQLAAGADVAAQNQIKFGQQLGAAAYDPFAAGFGAQAAVEKQAMMPLGLSTDLAAQFQKANAQGGVLNLEAQKAASNAMFPANQYNPYASLLSGASGNTQITGGLGNLFGNTSIGSALGNWLGSLGGYDMSALNQAASDWMSQNRDITPESTISGTTDTSWIDDYLEEQRRRNLE